MVCVYAPKFHAPGDMVKYFYDDLQDTLNNISSTDLLLMLVDLNATVGLRNRDSDVWSNMLGHFGIDDINQAGEHLLSFCDLNQLLLMNIRRPPLLVPGLIQQTKQCACGRH